MNMPLRSRKSANHLLTPCERFRILRLIRYNFPDFLRFLKRIPGYRKLDKTYDYEPDVYIHAIGTYERLIEELTGGRLSKPNYELNFLLDEIRERYCVGCDLKEKENAD